MIMLKQVPILRKWESVTDEINIAKVFSIRLINRGSRSNHISVNVFVPTKISYYSLIKMSFNIVLTLTL